ncbi:hypothetical protein L596_004917 [Steinernema carpocapsae]|uniref:Protein SEC13 homolog n=1 Tax=Steinernema carpocapsae TaxID=34508 RepID=A0A4U8UXJ7_STECR|nr:hypothetical protein L596_004917 [Steinernema carpocapsae]
MTSAVKVDTAHRDVIHDAQLNFSGTWLATCSHDHLVKVFEIHPNGNTFPKAELTGHEGPVWQVTWSHPKYDNVLASCSHDKKVIVWKEQKNWQKMYEYNQHEGSVNSICWAPHDYGLILACGSTDQNISILEFLADSTWNPVKIPAAHKCGVNGVSWAPFMSNAPIIEKEASRPTMRIVSGGNDNMVKIWKKESDQKWVLECTLEGHDDWVRDVAWAQTVAQGCATIASCGLDKRVIIWRSKNLDNPKSWTQTVLPLFEDVVNGVSWSLFGSVLAISCGDNKVSLWHEQAPDDWVQMASDHDDDMLDAD